MVEEIVQALSQGACVLVEPNLSRLAAPARWLLAAVLAAAGIAAARRARRDRLLRHELDAALAQVDRTLALHRRWVARAREGIGREPG